MVVIEISDVLDLEFAEYFKENKARGNRATDGLEELTTRLCAEVRPSSTFKGHTNDPILSISTLCY